jgi:hypothetical protein
VKSADLAVVNCEQLLTCRGQILKRADALQDVGLLEKACIASFKGKIIFLGEEIKLKKKELNLLLLNFLLLNLLFFPCWGQPCY